jgi:hypothetical protein
MSAPADRTVILNDCIVGCPTETPGTAQPREGPRNSFSGTILAAEDARTIYQVKKQGKSPRDAARLAGLYGITAKAVRDVWTHRTWTRATMSLWTVEDMELYMRRQLCADCCHAGVNLEKITAACTTCKAKVRKIVRRRTDLRGTRENGTAATAGPAAGPSASEPSHESTLSSDRYTFGSLRSSGWDQIWCRQDRHHSGLLQEALDSM